ncbi:protein EARLY FLOWERING 3-like [Senna tora]|uniref:Protein EARLY FLOWERING 3-like n=1 Tax=Senna tora TaxID=362788 RepID=A0A834U147_9FABA|nr:protein EARLY FLOWERING 3-like [Senna tora]
MKRGKDDEKFAGPMFPRLHVNDAEKGGPRAPPRNKMALYEQLSVPSHRFNRDALPLNPSSTSNTVPPASSSQGTGPQRSYAFPVHLPPQTPTYQAGRYISRQSDGANQNTSFAQIEQRKKIDEDDFRVPVYVHSRIGQSTDKIQESFSGNKITPMGSRYFGCSADVQNNCDRDPKQNGFSHVNIRRDVRSESERLPKVSPRIDQAKSVRNISKGENIDSLVRLAEVTPSQEYQDCHVASLGRLCQGDACIQPESGARSQSNDTGHGDGLVESRDTETGSTPLPRGCFHSTADKRGTVEAINNEYHDTGTGGLIQNGNLERSENVSKVTMVDDLSTMKISPDDVVEIIGQKHFWKARRAIVNQQRVFAVQVFELHRLIKVQQLIAGSPDLLIEEGAFLGKSPPKGSTPRKLSLEYVVKPRQQSIKRKDDSEKLNHKLECSAENAVGKTSLSSVKNGSHLSNYTPFSGNLHQANMSADSRMGPWCFHQSPGHQWLIPVMTSSEGLVYKPYPGPGFTGAACGGFGPFGPTPLGGNFMNPAYGVPASNNGIGVQPETLPGNHAYFPPYGMPVMNPAMSGLAVEQMNYVAATGSHGHLSGEGANFNAHNQSSYNLPVQRNETISNVMKIQASKGSELQGSTASSPSEMAQGISTGQIAEGRDALPLFSMAPETRQQTRVIKVVPHNPRSATESAARIFQSIQEERKQYDSV